MVSFHSRGRSSLKTPWRSVLFNIFISDLKNKKVNSEGTKLADGTKLLREVKIKTSYGVLRKILQCWQ